MVRLTIRISQERIWHLKANSKKELESWKTVFRNVIEGGGTRVLQDRGILQKLVRSLDWCNGWYDREFIGIPFLSSKDGEFVRSKTLCTMLLLTVMSGVEANSCAAVMMLQH